MIKFANEREMAEHFNFIPKTKADEKRLHKAWQMYVSNYRGAGCYGCISELLGATPHSRKQSIATQGKNDDYIRWLNDNGKVVNRPIEAKTNGGRIATANGKMFSGSFIRYRINLCNSGTGNKQRLTPEKLIPRDVFLSFLFEHGLVKEVYRNGVLDGYCIQSTSKVLYEWVLNWPVDFDRERIYSATDFEKLY